MGKDSKEITVTGKWIEFEGLRYEAQDLNSVKMMYISSPMAPEPKLLLTGNDGKRYEIDFLEMNMFHEISIGKKYIIQQKGIINKKVATETRVTS